MKTYTDKSRYMVRKNAPFTPVVIVYGVCLPDMTIGYIGFESIEDYKTWKKQK